MVSIKIGVIGAGGRMGRAIADLVHQDPAVTLAGLIEAPGSPSLGEERYGLRVTDQLATSLRDVNVLIDFTSPSASLAHAVLAAEGNVSFVLGTTGLDEAGRKNLSEVSKRIPIVFSPNMSLSANVLFDVAERVSALLPDYDAEVIEIHHNVKKDSPSGTAQRLAEAVQRGRTSGRFVYGRHGLVGERTKEEIGVHAVRGGDVVGDHTVLYLGNGERVELVHRVTSRTAFASGAVAAAKWVVGKPSGLYDMRDVLGLKKG
ncbi:MAG: 4-hydroxy-tetrahydrodipicolinate reductase [Elusimicrobia bacterium]|jgi:4-hydroxy-tetrahydrodipicolinate reductase|nr:4-hydroxy-tetrahydrodipicolinate reductase [Elusimicrobiota bacterium]